MHSKKMFPPFEKKKKRILVIPKIPLVVTVLEHKRTYRHIIHTSTFDDTSIGCKQGSADWEFGMGAVRVLLSYQKSYDNRVQCQSSTWTFGFLFLFFTFKSTLDKFLSFFLWYNPGWWRHIDARYIDVGVKRESPVYSFRGGSKE